jgi:hypothetical protein
MYTSLDLETFGKQISEQHFQTKESLTSLLSKVASSHELTSQQVHRVAESANIDTYLNMMKTAEEKYIKFEVADPIAVAHGQTQVVKTASVVTNYDYNTSLEDHLHDLIPSAEKTAEEITIPEPTNTEMQKEAGLKLGAVIRKENHLLDDQLIIASEFDSIEGLVKQALLGGTSFSDIAHVLKVAAPISNMGLITHIKADLEKNIPHHNFEVASCDRDLRTDSKLYKKAAAFDKSVDTLITKVAEYTEILQDYVTYVQDKELPILHKEAGVLKKVKNVGEFVGKHKVMSTMAVFVPVSYKAGKEKGKRDMSKNIKVIKGNK